MRKVSKKQLWFLFPFAVVILLLVWTVRNLNQEVSWQIVDEVSDQLSLSLRTELGNEKEEALRLALILSENDMIKDALKGDDEDRGFGVLKRIIGSVQKNTSELVRAQLITADSRLFARSWDADNLFAGMPLDTYRADLEEIRLHRKPRASIEVGRRLGIKATVPVYDGDNALLGFVEVLQFFDASTDFFHKFGIDLFVLLDDGYYNTAVLMQNNPAVAWFMVGNRRYNNVNLKVLQRLDFKKLRKERAMLSENKYVFYQPMQNGAGETIGAFVFVMPKKGITSRSCLPSRATTSMTSSKRSSTRTRSITAATTKPSSRSRTRCPKRTASFSWKRRATCFRPTARRSSSR